MSREMKHSGIEWIGEIPKEWKTCKGKLLYLSNDGGVWGEDPTGSDDTIVLRSTEQNIDGQLVIIDPAKRHLSKTEIENAILKEGDLIITKSSGSPSHIGKTSIIDREVALMNCCFSNFIQRIRVGGIAKYYWYNFNSPVIKDQFSFLSTTTTGINNINAKTIDLLMFPLPSLSEQQKIANYLDKVCGEVDEIIALQEQMIEELKAYKQSVITEAVTKGLNPDVPMRDSGIDWIGEIPEHWKVTVLRRFATIILGKMLQPNAKSDDDTLEQYICAKDVHFEGIDFSDLKKMYFDKNEKETYQVQKGDMLVVEGGAGAAGSCVLKTDLPDTYIQNSIMIVRPKQGIDIRYIQYFEFSLVKKGYVDFVCNKATIPHFTKDKLSSMPIPLPPLSEQQSIASYLDTKCAEIDALIALKQAKIEELKEYKKSVIYEYVTGKKEVV